MARLVAVEWDKNEVRLAAGSRQGNTIAIDTLLTAPLIAVNPEEPDSDPGLAKALREIAAKAGHAKGELLVGAGRTSVELRALQLPPASDNELPDMVRFAAQRQFAQLGDNWPLDFLKLPSSTSESIEVLAAAVNPATVNQIRKACEAAGLTVSQLLLRPTAAGSLASISSPQIRSETVLLVDVFNDEADLVITEQGNVSFVRTARLPQGDPSATQRSLAGEIKRTLIAAGSQRPSAVVTKIFVWGDANSTSALAAKLQESVGLPTAVLDPLDMVQSKSVRGSLPGGGSARFAPLIGMLMQAAGCSPNGIDFLHPRKRVEKKKPVREMALAGSLVGILLLVGVGFYLAWHWQLNSQIAELTKQDIALSIKQTNAKKQSLKWEKMQEFMKSDIQWLDQLDYFSAHALPATQMKVEKVVMQSDARSARSTILGNISISDANLLDDYENQIRRHKSYVVGHSKVVPAKSGSEYSFNADTTIEVMPSIPIDPLKKVTKSPAVEEPSPSKKEEAIETVPAPSPSDLPTEKNAEPEPSKPPTAALDADQKRVSDKSKNESITIAGSF